MASRWLVPMDTEVTTLYGCPVCTVLPIRSSSAKHHRDGRTDLRRAFTGSSDENHPTDPPASTPFVTQLSIREHFGDIRESRSYSLARRNSNCSPAFWFIWGESKMMAWIIGLSQRFRLLVVPAAAALFVVGIIQLRTAPTDVLPEYSPPTVQIQTEALGLSAVEVEQFITVPMEQDLLNGVPWLETITSKSVPGLSQVDLVFQAGTDEIGR